MTEQLPLPGSRAALGRIRRAVIVVQRVEHMGVEDWSTTVTLEQFGGRSWTLSQALPGYRSIEDNLHALGHALCVWELFGEGKWSEWLDACTVAFKDAAEEPF